MRNLLLFLIFSSFNSVILNAQHIVYHEGFDNGMPLGYKTYDIDGLTQYPGAFYLNFLGKAWVESNGRAVSTSYYSPPGTSNDWMISLPISIPDIGSGEKIMLAWQELSPDYNYRDSYRVLISEKDQEINSFIDIIYNSPSTVTTDFLRYVTVDLSAYANKTIYLAFQNNSEDKYLLYIDNITIVKSPQFGLGAINLENLVYNKANSLVDVRGNILNMGWDTLRSFKFTYQLDNDPPQQSIVSNLNFSPFTGESYSGNARLSVPYGKHKLSFWGTDINGTSNISDTSTMTIFGYGEKDYVPRNLMLEQFTSSSCQACNTGNNILKSLTGNLETKPIIIKYPQDFPLGGDPYCTKETYNRRIYYNVKSIPCSILDGNTLEINPGSLTQELILGSADREALVKFNFKYIIDVPNHSIHVFGTYRPTVDLVEGTRLMVGIKEKLSYKNIGINGETEFDNILKKMLPDEKGLSVDDKPANVFQKLDLVYTFPGEYRLPENGKDKRINLDYEHSVEDFNNLLVDVWIENTNDKFVLNASEAERSSDANESMAIEYLKVFPNPARHYATVSIKMNEDMEGKLIVTNMSGQEVWNSRYNLTIGQNYIELPVLASLSSGAFNVQFISGDRIAVHKFIVE